MSSRPDGWKPSRRPGPPPPSGRRTPYWPAQWPGECQACPEPIQVGQEITRADAGGYVHMECPVPPPADKFVGTDDESMGF